MKGFVEVTQEEGLWYIEVLPRDIGGPICKKKHKTMQERPFPKAAGNRRWLLVGTDYFTKWVKAKPLLNIRDVDAKKFFWKNIVTRYFTPSYPQGDGQAEAVNKVIVSGLKKRLDDFKGRWVEELPHVLWTYRTTPRRSTEKTHFSMTYGVKAVIPLETGFPMIKTSSFIPSNNDGLLEKGLDLVDERRENVMVQLAYYQQKLKQ
ncbi:uncharacterized protein LOC142632427 [Castanea sativa]|uniref:uncharacterized protein LOC142632427 n=1 Tax=Castanea sativa TaxID=21020 RepID=UPI003F64F722